VFFGPTGRALIGGAADLLANSRSTIVAFATERERDSELTPEEIRSCRALPAERRGEWRAGRLAVKRAAAAALGVRPLELTTTAVDVDESGPCVRLLAADGTPVEAGIHVSLTHCDGLAAGVADISNRVGIDIEREGAVWPAARRYFLTAKEQQSPLSATILWSLKEAAWKALRCRGSTVFSSLELGFNRAGALESLTLEGTEHRAGSMIWTPRVGYVLAVVWTEQEQA
jgi:4'-phosphopantetheinyl transferase EntD